MRIVKCLLLFEEEMRALNFPDIPFDRLLGCLFKTENFALTAGFFLLELWPWNGDFYLPYETGGLWTRDSVFCSPRVPIKKEGAD